MLHVRPVNDVMPTEPCTSCTASATVTSAHPPISVTIPGLSCTVINMGQGKAPSHLSHIKSKCHTSTSNNHTIYLNCCHNAFYQQICTCPALSEVTVYHFIRLFGKRCSCLVSRKSSYRAEESFPECLTVKMSNPKMSNPKMSNGVLIRSKKALTGLQFLLRQVSSCISLQMRTCVC